MIKYDDCEGFEGYLTDSDAIVERNVSHETFGETRAKLFFCRALSQKLLPEYSCHTHLQQLLLILESVGECTSGSVGLRVRHVTSSRSTYTCHFSGKKVTGTSA